MFPHCWQMSCLPSPRVGNMGKNDHFWVLPIAAHPAPCFVLEGEMRGWWLRIGTVGIWVLLASAAPFLLHSWGCVIGINCLLIPHVMAGREGTDPAGALGGKWGKSKGTWGKSGGKWGKSGGKRGKSKGKRGKSGGKWGKFGGKWGFTGQRVQSKAAAHSAAPPRALRWVSWGKHGAVGAQWDTVENGHVCP